MADIIDKLIGRLAHHMPGASHDALLRAEAHLRSEFGGCEAGYIAKRPTLQRAVAIGEQLQQGSSLAVAFAAAGTARRQGYRVLSKRARRP